MKPRFSLDGDTILEDDRPVAKVIGGGTDEGLRLVGFLNMFDRDEGLLEHIVEVASNRNMSTTTHE